MIMKDDGSLINLLRYNSLHQLYVSHIDCFSIMIGLDFRGLKLDVKGNTDAA